MQATGSFGQRLGHATLRGLVGGLILGVLGLAGILMLPGTSEEASPAFAVLEVVASPPIEVAAR